MTDSIIVDAYEGDGKKDWAALAAAGEPYRGVILKATQGTYYSGGDWFQSNWRAVMHAGYSANRASQWVRGAYHYLDTRLDPVAQADYFCRTIERAGGLFARDILMVDVERVGQRTGIVGRQVVDVVSSFVAKVTKITGKWVMLYGGSWLYDLGIMDRMGCKYLAIARYTAELPRHVVQRIGWPVELVALWQYAGVDSKGKSIPFDPRDQLKDKAGSAYPNSPPGCGPIDCSAVILPGGTDSLIA